MIRLTRVQVEAYRGLRGLDLTLDAPPGQPLTVLLGPNEAGKSTLLEFIREVLFGSGEALGSVALDAGGRRYRVTAGGRRQRRVVDLTSGEDCPPGTARELLGSIDAQVFQNVFAFGLGELQSLSSLTAQGVQERIFAAGVAGAGPSARAALQGLERDTQEYLRPRSGARLNDGARAYGELRRLVRGAQEQAGQYETWTAERQALQADLQRDEDGQARLAVRLQELEHLQRLWPQWVDRTQAQQALAGLDVPPLDPAAVLCEVRPLVANQAELETAAAGVRGELAALPDGQGPLLAAAGDLEALGEELAAHLEREATLEQQQAGVAATRAQMAAQRQTLPGEWPLGVLETFHAEEVLPLLEEAGRALTDAAARQADLQLGRDEAERDLGRARSFLDTLPAPGPLQEPARTQEERLAREARVAAGERLGLAREAVADGPDLGLTSRLPALRTLLDSAPLPLMADLPRRRQERQRQLGQLGQAVADLGEGWTRGRLEGLRREEERAWRAEGQRQARTLDDLRRAEEDALRTRAAREQATRESELRLAEWGDVPATAELDARLATLHTRQATAAAVRARLQGQGGTPAPARPGPGWPVGASLGLTAVLTVAALTVHPLLALLTLVCGLGLAFLQRPVQGAGAGPAQERGADLQADLQALGLPPQADVGAVAALASDLGTQLAALSRLRDTAGARDEAGRRLQTDRTLLTRADEALRDASERLEAARDAFHTWTAQEHLNVERPGELDAFLLRVMSARELALGLGGLEEDLQQMEEELGAFQTRVTATLGHAASPEDLLPLLQARVAQGEEASQAARQQAAAREAVHARQEDLEREQARLDAVRAELARRHAAALAEVQRLEALAVARRAEFEVAAQATRGAEQTWAARLQERGLPAGTPAELRVLVERLQRVADTARNLRDQEAQLTLLQGQVQAFRAACAGVLAPLLGEPSADLAPALRARVAAARQATATARRRDELRVNLAGLAQQAAQVGESLGARLEHCGVPDVATLERWEQLVRQRQALQERMGQAERDLQLLAGQRAPELRLQLEQAHPDAWEAELGQLRGRQETLGAVQSTRRQRLAMLDLELERLSESADSARLQLHLQAQVATLQQDARTWLVRRLAAQLLGDTLKEYERTRGPEVLRHASAVFAGVTQGRYTAIRQVEGAATFRAVTNADELVDVGQLSRGTQEQLYLAVRLGLARTLGQRTVHLPLLMDDILVNADPERAAAVAETLAEVAHHHQVLYLTCHPSSAEQLQAVAEDAQVIPLPRLTGHVSLVQPDAPLTGGVAALRQHLAAQVEPRGFTELEAALAPMASAELRACLRSLEESGLVVRQGRGRGTRYALAEALPVA